MSSREADESDAADHAAAINEAEALLEVAKAIRDLPREQIREQRRSRSALGSAGSIMEMTAALTDPAKIRERKREMKEDERARRTELRANVAIVIAAVGALGSILAVALH